MDESKYVLNGKTDFLKMEPLQTQKIRLVWEQISISK